MKMKKNGFVLILMLCIALVMAACGDGSTSTDKDVNAGGTSSSTPAGSSPVAPSPTPVQKELTISHQLGDTKVMTNPKKVIVFDFGALDSLDKLGVEVVGVAQANLPPYLAKYKESKYQNIGTLQEPDYEKISSIKPDLILISGRQQAAYPELSKLAPTVYVGVDTKNYLESYKTNMKRLGEIFGKEKFVEEELGKADNMISDVQDKVKASNKNALIILANDGAISAYGPGSRFGIIHDVLGIPAVDKNLEVSTHGQSISFEFIAEKNPEYLFVVDRGAVVEGTTGTGAKALVENELVKKTNAYKNGNIVYLDPNYWYLSGGGLISTTEMINQISKGYK